MQELPIISGSNRDYGPSRELVQRHLAALRSPKEKPENLEATKDRVKQLLVRENAVLVAHYYTDPAIQSLAEETGGCVSDSLEMARFGAKHDADTLVVAGVRFMGETAKILTPDKRVIMPTLEAECSLDLGCPPEEFAKFCDEHPDYTVVVYANTSAAVKARADWVVTSSIAVPILEHLADLGEKVIWAPDKHLGGYLQRETGAEMLLWDAACVVHEEFKSRGVKLLKEDFPDAAVLVHPESPAEVVALADVVGSTSQLIKAAGELPNKRFIVATDQGIFYKMQQLNPGKEFHIAPTAGKGADCRSCSFCPWMAMNELDALATALDAGLNEIHIDPETARRAMIPLNRMLEFAEDYAIRVQGKA